MSSNDQWISVIRDFAQSLGKDPDKFTQGHENIKRVLDDGLSERFEVVLISDDQCDGSQITAAQLERFLAESSDLTLADLSDIKGWQRG